MGQGHVELNVCGINETVFKTSCLNKSFTINLRGASVLCLSAARRTS